MCSSQSNDPRSYRPTQGEITATRALNSGAEKGVSPTAEGA